MISSDEASGTILTNWLVERTPLSVRLEVRSGAFVSVVLECDVTLQAFDSEAMDFESRIRSVSCGVTLMFESGEANISAPVPAANRPGSVAILVVSGSVSCSIVGEPVAYGRGAV
jgi:hypothetical protein